MTADTAAELEATRAERDRLRLTITGTRAALDLVQEECDDANEALDAARQQLAREVAAYRDEYAYAERVAARLVEVICEQDEDPFVARWRSARAEKDEAWSAYKRAADDRDKAEAALAEANARGDEWSRVAHGWAAQRDDARRRAEEAERVIEAYRGHPLRDGLTLPEPATQGVNLLVAVGRAVEQARREHRVNERGADA